MRVTCPAHLIPFDLTTLTTFGEEYKSRDSSWCSLLQPPAFRERRWEHEVQNWTEWYQKVYTLLILFLLISMNFWRSMLQILCPFPLKRIQVPGPLWHFLTVRDFSPRPSLQLSATAYSIYSQLPSTSGGRFPHLQPEDATCRCDRDPLNVARLVLNALNSAVRVQKIIFFIF